MEKKNYTHSPWDPVCPMVGCWFGDKSSTYEIPIVVGRLARQAAPMSLTKCSVGTSLTAAGIAMAASRTEMGATALPSPSPIENSTASRSPFPTTSRPMIDEQTTERAAEIGGAVTGRKPSLAELWRRHRRCSCNSSCPPIEREER